MKSFCRLQFGLLLLAGTHSSASTKADEQTNDSLRSFRRLQTEQQSLQKTTKKDTKIMSLERVLQSGSLLATRSFPECIEENLTPEACRSRIEEMIESAGGHQVGEVEVKIQVPRTPEEFDDSYWMVEVPSDIYRNVACDRNNAQITYPFLWDDGSGGGGVPVESLDCSGLSVGQCCLNLRNYGQTLTASGGYDVNDQCLSCFAYREPLVPVFNEFTDSTDYEEYRLLEGACTRYQLTEDDVLIEDSEQGFFSFSAKDLLETFINASPRSCSNFDDMLENLYDAAIPFPALPVKIGELACSICYGSNDKALDDPSVTALLNEILSMLQPDPPSAKENCILIYTNEDGTVATTPSLGGSRSDFEGSPGGPDGGGIGECLCTPNQVCEPNPSNGGALECRDQTCDENASICADNETCDDFGSGFFECRPTRCNEDASICTSDEVCDFLPTEDDPYYFTYQCRPLSCRDNSSLCSTDEFCVRLELQPSLYECALNPCSLDPSPCPNGLFCELLFPEFGLDFECKDLGV